MVCRDMDNVVDARVGDACCSCVFGVVLLGFIPYSLVDGGTEMICKEKNMPERQIEGAAKPTSDNSHPEVLRGLAWLKPWATATLLDVGCGGGHFLKAAAEQGYETYGLDVDMRMVLTTRRQLENIDDAAKHVIQGLIGDHLPGLWPHFDYVSCFEVIEHTENPFEALVWLRERLKPGGWLVGSVPNNERSKVSTGVLLKCLPNTDGELIEINRHKNSFDVNVVKDLLPSAGFASVEVCKTRKGNKKRLLFRGKRPGI